MYIDTEGTFRPERLLAVAERSVLTAGSKLGVYSWDNLVKKDHCVDQPVSLNSCSCCSKNCP